MSDTKSARLHRQEVDAVSKSCKRLEGKTSEGRIMSGEHKIVGGARELSDLVPAFHDREAELIRQLDGARLMSLQYLKELESEREKLASLVEAAEYAVKNTKFSPGKQRGKPVKVKVMIPVVFQLEAGPA
mgnify:CR=1 FL=1